MVQRYLFFNSITGDRRRYQAQDFARYFDSVLSSGLLHTDEVPGMAVSVESGTMNTIVSDGRAIMRGHWYENTTPFTLEHSIPEPNEDRIDRIVLRLDLRQAQRNILLHVKEGVSAEVPSPPELQRDEHIYEISLAQIYVHRNTSTLQQVDLVDERLNEDLCGLVHSLISIPTSQFQEQWDLFFSNKSAEVTQAASDYMQALLDAEQALQDDLADFNQQWNDWFSQQQTEGFVLQTEKGQPNGIASLDSAGKVPESQLPDMDYVPLSEKGEPGGVAALGSDGQIAQKPYVTGTYTGNGAASRTINLGFRPSAVFVMPKGYLHAHNAPSDFMGLVISNYPSGNGSNGDKTIEVTSNGFTVFDSANTNEPNFNPFRYIAWR